MESYRLLEYRPGRWAKIDAVNGIFLGPATPQEVRAWKDNGGSSAGTHPPIEEAKAPRTDHDLTRSQSMALAYDAGQISDLPLPPPSPESEPADPATQQPEPEGMVGGPVPQEPPGEGKAGDPTPQEPDPEGKTGEPAPEQPVPEGTTGDPAPQEPVPEGKTGDPAPEQPAPEGTTGDPAPQEPVPESKTGEPAPQQPAPKPGDSGQVGSSGLAYPLEKRYRITSTFEDHKRRNPPSTAPGIDLGCPSGTEVRAWAAGRVTRARWTEAGGLSIWIQHTKSIRTYYAHLRSVSVVEGEAVSTRQKIGESGNTGHTTGPHLHFSVVRNGQYMDPEEFLRFAGNIGL